MGSIRRATGRMLLAALAALALLATGCASIPSEGPVGTIAPSSSAGTLPAYTFSPPGPEAGASPEEIVEGFYRAGIAPQDDYNVAREYLALPLAFDWRGAERTLIFEAEPSIVSNVADGSYSVQLEVVATVDSHGVKTDMPPNTTERLDVKLAKVDGEWRITEAPNGTLIEQGSFDILFAPHTLYFYDATYTYVVPDVRWYANRQGLAATIVESLLAGPAEYLRGAVFSAFPEGSTLSRPSVPVESGRASVDLVPTVLADATDLRRQQMQQQLELTLASLSYISFVSMTVDQREVVLGASAPGFTQAIVDPSVPNTQIAVAGRALAFYQGDGPVPVGGVEDISAFYPRDPAMAPGGNRYAFLDGARRRLVTVDEAGNAKVAAAGTALVAPSIDTHGWTWTVDNATPAHVLAVSANPARDGRAREISAQWLAGGTVQSLRISRDGARALVVARIDGAMGLFVSGVIRDSEGVPRGFTEPLELQASVAVGRAVWDSAQSVVVMRPDPEGPVQAERIGLDGTSELFLPLDGMTGISAGAGERRQIYAETRDAIYSRVGNSWSEQAGRARYLAYPG